MKKHNKSHLIAAMIGNILEMYEYALYGYFGPIIAKLFFASPDQAIRLTATFCIFAAGYLMRPLGAVVFGYLGDRYGRKTTLASAILLMAIPTTLIGLLPTYIQAGFLGCVLLTICRLLQGLAIGGEFCGSMIYLMEHCPANRRGLYGGWIWFTGSAGFLLGSMISAFVINTMSTENLYAWGWRIPFLSGLFLGMVGLYLRLRMPETADFLALKAAGTILQNPIKTALRTQQKIMFQLAALIFLPASAFFIFFVYLSAYLNTSLNIPLHTTLFLNSIAMIIFMPSLPIVGMLSDKIGKKPVLLIGAFGFCFLSYPGFLLLQQGTAINILSAQVGFGFLISCCYAPLPGIMAESLPVNLRYSAIALPFNIIVALTSAITPIIAAFLNATTHDFVAPSYYLILLGALMIFSIVTMNQLAQPSAEVLTD